jgi:hypothetical protein
MNTQNSIPWLFKASLNHSLHDQYISETPETSSASWLPKTKQKKILGQNNLIDICSRLPELVTHLNNNNFKGGKGTSKVFSLQTPN